MAAMSYRGVGLLLLALAAVLPDVTFAQQGEFYNATLVPLNEDTEGSSGYVLLNYLNNAFGYLVQVNGVAGLRSVQLKIGTDDQTTGPTVAVLYTVARDPDFTTPVTGAVAQGTLTYYDLVGPLQLPNNEFISIKDFHDRYFQTGAVYAVANTLAHPNGALRGQFSEEEVVDIGAALPVVFPVNSGDFTPGYDSFNATEYPVGEGEGEGEGESEGEGEGEGTR